MYAVNATGRKDNWYINNSSKLKVKFCHTLSSNMAS